MFRETVKMSWQNIIGNKMRSFLTILGIVIGVTAIISLITIVQGVIDETNRQFISIGTGKITIRAHGTPLKQGLSANDVKKLNDIENVAGVLPNLSIKASAVKDGVVLDDVTIDGKNEVYFNTTDDLISRGRGFNILDMNSKNRVAIVDIDISKELFFGKDPLNEKITINGTVYTVVGVLKDSSDDIMAMMNASSSSNGKILIPYTTAMSMAGTGSISSLEMIIEDTDRMDEVINQVELVLNQTFNFKENSFYIINLDRLLEAMQTMQGMMTSMLVGIAAISLLVGGIGIMNMMLVSVTERTTEIGLRKALGAEPSNIQIQFLIEAIFLSLLGGLIGLILGALISSIASSIIDIPLKLSPSAVALGVGFSAAIGIIFGWAPARKASLLNPIDALRSV